MYLVNMSYYSSPPLNINDVPVLLKSVITITNSYIIIIFGCYLSAGTDVYNIIYADLATNLSVKNS